MGGDISIERNNALVLTSIVSGSNVVIKDPSISSDGADNNVIKRISSVSGNTAEWNYRNAAPLVDVEIYKTGYKMQKISNIITGSNQAIPVSQQIDGTYS